MNEPSDRELMQRLARGDRDALGPLMERHHRRLFRIALSYLRDVDEAMDAVQETFVKAYQAAARWDPVSEVAPWLSRIAVNHSIDCYRRRRRRRRTEEPMSDLPADHDSRWRAGDPSPENEASGREVGQRIAAALRTLPERQRAIFVLRHYDERSLPEIADALGMSLGTVKSSLHRAIARLRDRLGERVGVTLFHERWRVRVSLLAARALEPPEEPAVRAHLESCDACRADFERSLRALDVLARDPVRSAELPVPVEFLKSRVQARLDEAAAVRPFRWGFAGAGLAAAALAVAIVPALVQRAPTPGAAVVTEMPLVPADTMARMERRLARDSAARYLDEAQDLLVTVSAHPADCEDDHGRIDVGEEARRSRELLERRALMVELGGDEVASAQPLLDDVEGLLREVAALPACVRADSLDAIHDQMERRKVLMKIDLMTRELRG